MNTKNYNAEKRKEKGKADNERKLSGCAAYGRLVK